MEFFIKEGLRETKAKSGFCTRRRAAGAAGIQQGRNGEIVLDKRRRSAWNKGNVGLRASCGRQGRHSKRGNGVKIQPTGRFVPAVKVDVLLGANFVLVGLKRVVRGVYRRLRQGPYQRPGRQKAEETVQNAVGARSGGEHGTKVEQRFAPVGFKRIKVFDGGRPN
jgi:hypothetical protein